MGDRMFASEGDSRNLGRQEAPMWGSRWDGGRPRRAADEDASAGVARRLQSRLDRHLWLLDRMRSDPLQPEPPGLRELMETARRMRGDVESLLLLCGQDPGADSGGPRKLADVVGEAVASTEEPRRVDVGPAPAATLTAPAAVELQHVIAELVDHVLAVYPGVRVELGCRVDTPAGIVVEVRADGAARHVPDGLGGRPAMEAAERLAARSRSGIALRRPATGAGPVASVHCPGAVVTLEEPGPGPASGATDTPGHDAPGHDEPGSGGVDGRVISNGGNGNGHPAGPIPAGPGPTVPVPVYEPDAAPAGRSTVDELFGPLLDLAYEPDDGMAATPIFEAIASAWFREDAPDPGVPRDPLTDPLDWESPSDGEWQAAARAVQPGPPQLTSQGLPRRRPGDQLVPPSRSVTDPERAAAERVPDRVRDRLTTYQRGLRHGRHRAEPAQGADLDDAGAG